MFSVLENQSGATELNMMSFDYLIYAFSTCRKNHGRIFMKILINCTKHNFFSSQLNEWNFRLIVIK